MGQFTDTLCPNCFSKNYENGLCRVCGYQERLNRKYELALPHGTVLNQRYILGKVLGEGGFGITYKAYDILTQRITAVKEFAPVNAYQRADNGITMTHNAHDTREGFQQNKMLFLAESQLLNRLVGIRNVLQIIDTFQENGTAYFVTDYLDGYTLKDQARAVNFTLPLPEILRVMRVVCTTMAAIHEDSGILHRDLSPDNIFCLYNGGIRIIDFGSAQQIGLDAEHMHVQQIKEAYAAPEQFSFDTVQDTYTDVYALAGTFYYVMTGIHIPPARERRGVNDYVPLMAIRQDVSEKVSAAIDRALVLDYRNRTQTMGRFLYELTDEMPDMQAVFSAGRRVVKPYLKMETGVQAGMIWPLKPNRWVYVGREVAAGEIAISSLYDKASKVHCAVLFNSKEEKFYVTDLSRNGTYCGSERLEKGRQCPVRVSSKLCLANRDCIIQLGVKI